MVYSDDIGTFSNKSPKDTTLIAPPRAANATQKTIKPFTVQDQIEEIVETCGDILSSSNDESVPVKEISISGS